MGKVTFVGRETFWQFRQFWLDCERSLFCRKFSEESARARASSSEAARRETRETSAAAREEKLQTVPIARANEFCVRLTRQKYDWRMVKSQRRIWFTWQSRIFSVLSKRRSPLNVHNKYRMSGLSLRAGGRGFSPATKRVAPGYFYWKIEEK